MENEMHMRLTYREVKASELEGYQHCPVSGPLCIRGCILTGAQERAIFY